MSIEQFFTKFTYIEFKLWFSDKIDDVKPV